MAKLEHNKHKELIKSKANELKGTSFGINDQFPRERNERRKVLYPIKKEHRQKNRTAYIVVDKLVVLQLNNYTVAILNNLSKHSQAIKKTTYK